MRLHQLLAAINAKADPEWRHVEIQSLSTDSRTTEPGALFIATRGLQADGHDFIAKAVARGARAVVAERPVIVEAVPVVVTESTRKAVSRLSTVFFGSPSASMTVVGVTGTNGKTTTTHLISSILREAGLPCGLIGTIRYQVGDFEVPATHTTPDPVVLQGLLARMRDRGIQAAVMEVSSHSLDQGRVDDVTFKVGVFTNLTGDHLDYHKSLHAYREAKGRLFRLLPAQGAAVVNIDDPSASYFLRQAHCKPVTYGLSGDADVTASVLRSDSRGSTIRVSAPGGDFEADVALVGRHNVSNCLAAVAAAQFLGISAEAIARALGSVVNVDGRLERVDCGQDFDVFVDYAHTDDALKNVLEALRPLTRGRLIVVFGCGGDRDRTKRPRMGRVAAELADRVIITSDNPRSEDPLDIIAEIRAGVTDNGGVTEIADRAEAIEKAVAEAASGDVVLIAGKGHETYQVFRDKSIDFDDRRVVREILSR